LITKYTKEFLDPSREHSAYHDVESFFWVFLWAFARAQPENSNPEQAGEYNHFCDVMLRHTIGEIDEIDERLPYLFHPEAYVSKIFLPTLLRFSGLFINMAEYLSIPWPRFHSLNLPADHAHQAMLRLLLGTIVKEQNTPT